MNLEDLRKLFNLNLHLFRLDSKPRPSSILSLKSRLHTLLISMSPAHTHTHTHGDRFLFFQRQNSHPCLLFDSFGSSACSSKGLKGPGRLSREEGLHTRVTVSSTSHQIRCPGILKGFLNGELIRSFSVYCFLQALAKLILAYNNPVRYSNDSWYFESRR